ncbi:MAG: M56 family metallopeptidase [Bryobacteraceae bacterium]
MTNIILAAALKGTFLLGIAWIATALLRQHSADLRHRIWLAALIAMALLLIPVPVPETLWIVVGATTNGMGTAAGSTRSVSMVPMVWSVIAALLMLRWAAGILRLHRITRASRRGNDVRISDAIGTPLTWGAIRPVILVPAYVEDWPTEQRDVVIRHERAHIERRDWLWQGFAQVMTAVFWFHPLVWLAAAQMRQEAEHAADDATLAAGVQAPDYADRLMAVARQLKSVSPAGAVAMLRKPVLTSRIAAILDASRLRTGASVGARIGVVLAAAAILMPLSAFQNRPIYHAGEDRVTIPSVTYRVDPSYTEEAKEAKIQGTVGLSLVVNSQGRADDVKVTQSLETGLDLNAVAAVSQWLFKPGTKDGQPVDVAVKIEVNFKLK